MGAESIALIAFAFVLTYAIHSTLLLGLACVVASRVAVLRARERLWKLALFGGLATAGVQVGCGLHTPLVHWSLASPQVAAVEPAGDSADEPQSGAVDAGAVDAQRIAEQATMALQLALVRLACAEQPLDDQAAQVEPLAPTSGRPSLLSPAVQSSPLEAATLLDGAAVVVPVADAPVADVPGGEGPAAASLTPLAASTRIAREWLTNPIANWRTWLTRGLVVWAAFSALSCALFAWMWLRLARRLRGRVELTSGILRAALDRLVPLAFPRGRRIRLFVAPDLGAPLSFGWWRPSICVPPRALLELSSDEQETMLAHELAHLKRRDPVWLSLAWFVERVFFFQPLNRVARAQLHDAAELLCDEWAVRRTGNRVALASCLARIAGWIVGPARALPATSMADGHGRSRLGQRIERLLDEHSLRHEEHPRGWIAPLAAGALGIAVLVVPGVSADRLDAEVWNGDGRDVTDVPFEDDEKCELVAGDGCELDIDTANSLAPSDEEIADALAAAQAVTFAETPAEMQTPPPRAAPDSQESRDEDEPGPAGDTPPAEHVSAVEGPRDFAATREALLALDSLDEAMRALEHELDALRDVLADLDDDELEPTLDQLEERAEHLAERRTHLRRLLFQVVSQAEQDDSGAASDEFEMDAR